MPPAVRWLLFTPCSRLNLSPLFMTVIQVEKLSKLYRLGEVGTGTISHDLNRWWHRVRGKEDPYLKIGQPNDRTRKGDSDYAWALQDVSFDVKQGEVLGIIGRNGAGKSTLLKILSRVTTPTSGEIKIRGRIASLLEVGTGFHPELTGRDNIYLNGAILGMRKREIDRKFDEIVAFAEVERYIDTPVKRYSSGMYVRLAFAVAAHLEPEILIVDEVLAVGDIEFQKKCLGKMEDVSKGGRTVLFVSHNMDAVLRLCNRSVLLKDGMIHQTGETRQVVSAYMAHRTKQNAIIDLSQMKRDLHPRLKARYTEVKMVSPAGLREWQIPYGEHLSFEIALETGCVLSGLELGISIYTAAGAEITSNLSSHSLALKETPAGRHVFKATFPGLRLLPGNYYVQLGLRSETGFEDFIPRACEFDVLTSELSSRQMTDTFRGILVPEVEYEFK